MEKIYFETIRCLLISKFDDEVWRVSSYIAECREIEEDYRKLWDSGVSFLAGPFDNVQVLFGADPVKREEDTDKEANACAEKLHEELVGAIRQHWIRNLKREHAVALLNIMCQEITRDRCLADESGTAYYKYGGQYTIIKGVNLDYCAYTRPEVLMEAWNTAHPDEEPISIKWVYGDDDAKEGMTADEG